MKCPKCGAKADGVVVCRVCDYVVDTSFLGNDFTNEPSGQHRAEVSTDRYGAPPVLLGDPSADIDAFVGEDSGGFLSAATQDGMRIVSPVSVYVGGDVARLLEPDAVLSLREGVRPPSLVLSPSELRVLAFCDGARPVARLQALVGLPADAFRLALALLVDKKVLVRSGTARGPGVDDAAEFEAATRVESPSLRQLRAQPADGEKLATLHLPLANKRPEDTPTLQLRHRQQRGGEHDPETPPWPVPQGALAAALEAPTLDQAARRIETLPDGRIDPADRTTPGARTAPRQTQQDARTSMRDDRAASALDSRLVTRDDDVSAEARDSALSRALDAATRDDRSARNVAARATSLVSDDDGFDAYVSPPLSSFSIPSGGAPVSDAPADRATDANALISDALASSLPSGIASSLPSGAATAQPADLASSLVGVRSTLLTTTPPGVAPPAPSPVPSSPSPAAPAHASAPSLRSVTTKREVPMARMATPAAMRQAAAHIPPGRAPALSVLSASSSTPEMTPAPDAPSSAEWNVASVVAGRVGVQYGDELRAFSDIVQKPVLHEHALFDDALRAEEEGDFDKAVTLLRRALQLAPRSAPLHNRLGVLLATRIKDLDGALDHLRIAVEIEPHHPVFMNNLGKVAAAVERRRAPADSSTGHENRDGGGGLRDLFRRLFKRD